MVELRLGQQRVAVLQGVELMLEMGFCSGVASSSDSGARAGKSPLSGSPGAPRTQVLSICLVQVSLPGPGCEEEEGTKGTRVHVHISVCVPMCLRE